MGRGNADPSAKTSGEHSWKALPGLILSLMSRKAQNRSISIQVLFTDCFSDKIISRKYLSSYWKMLIWKIQELDFSASIHYFTVKYSIYFVTMIIILSGNIRKRLHKVLLVWKHKWYLPLQRFQRPKAIYLLFAAWNRVSMLTRTISKAGEHLILVSVEGQTSPNYCEYG